jgi:hypothetical protein
MQNPGEKELSRERELGGEPEDSAAHPGLLKDERLRLEIDQV